MPVIGTPFSTHWGSLAGMQAKYGRVNLTTSADPDQTGDAVYIASRYEAALTAGDNRITLRAAELRVSLPDPASPYSLYFAEFANLYGGAWLSSARGQPLEAGFQEFGEYQAAVNVAEGRLTGSLMALRELNGITGVHVSAATALGQGTNATGAPQPYRWGLFAGNYWR